MVCLIFSGSAGIATAFFFDEADGDVLLVTLTTFLALAFGLSLACSR